MTAPVAVPEKSLEHWVSQYVLYRYRSHAAMWWPTRGEDVDVRWFPPAPGKVIQLEVKTCVPVRSRPHVPYRPDFQEVFVDLGQLWDYVHRSRGQRPFYVFPRPDWNGGLEETARLAGRFVTELAFSRSGPAWWFADWMIVLTADQVVDILRSEMTAHGSRIRGTSCRLVRFEMWPVGGVRREVWGSPTHPVPSPAYLRWRQFWAELEACGMMGWPQLVRVPKADNRRRHTRGEVIELLRRSTNSEAGRRSELVTLEPDGDGGFRFADQPSVEDDGAAAGIEDDDNRQAIFLSADALIL